MHVFAMMWAAMKRMATSMNALSDEFDAMRDELQARRLGVAPSEVVDAKLEHREEPKPETNGHGRRKAAAS